MTHLKTVRWLILILIILGGLTASAQAGRKPNFIIINIDDLGYADIEPFGSKVNRTPNLNRMAAEGRKLTSHYAAPVCSPSRASLMTGSYPKRSLSIPHVLFPGNDFGLDQRETTIAELLKQQGVGSLDGVGLDIYHLGCKAANLKGSYPGIYIFSTTGCQKHFYQLGISF